MEPFAHHDLVLTYRTRGDGPPLVFLHNGGASSAIWREQETTLADRYSVVVVDLPGFGSAPRTRRDGDLAGHIALVAALLDELGATPSVVVGNCMGSAIAAGLAAERPDLVAGLVLTNPLTEATFSAGGLGLLHRLDRALPAVSRVVRGAARRLPTPRPAAVGSVWFQLGPAGVARQLHHDPELLANYSRREQLPALIDVLDDLGAYGRLDHATERTGAPLCTVWGARNRVLSPAAGLRLNERLRPDRCEVLADCGHLPMLEDPDTYTAIVDEFARTCFDALARPAQEAS
jgi:pimeloyl-ACP methyl ester carboxylesterase